MWNVREVVSTPPPAPGFIGEGHTAVEVVTSDDLPRTDPFVLLMDDRLHIARRRQIGGAHPHAGLETVTFVLEGTLHDRDEGDLQAGDVLWMTAGRGVIHNEAVEAVGRSRILQLWIALPAADRDLAPDFELVRGATAPLIEAAGVHARLYSGTANGVRSPTRNRVSTTMIDVRLEPNATFDLDLPATHTGFAYVLEGDVRIADARVQSTHVAWLLSDGEPDALHLHAGPEGARLVLYAGEPIREPLVHRGPFVAGNTRELTGYYVRFQQGEFTPLSQLHR
jgi:quercetin 2,3-dioxygenase